MKWWKWQADASQNQLKKQKKIIRLFIVDCLFGKPTQLPIYEEITICIVVIWIPITDKLITDPNIKFRKRNVCLNILWIEFTKI